VYVLKVHLATFRSPHQIRPKTLGQNGFACSNVACDEDALAGGEWGLERETEELGEETHLLVAVRKVGGHVFQ
jgi:hypothetical protein